MTIQLLLLFRLSAGAAVYGGVADLGYYFMDVSIGTPAQRLSVIIDTGSEGLLVTCTACTRCGSEHMDPFFDPELSSSFAAVCPTSFFRNDQCSFQKQYLEGSHLKGRIVEDFVLSKTMKFGCIESESRMFLSQKANGIFGLAPQTEPLVDVFSLCLASNGGDFYAHDRNFFHPEFINLAYLSGHYVVAPVALWVQGSQHPAVLLGSQVLIDSGSTITYLKQSLFDLVVGEIGKKFNKSNSDCWQGPNFHVPEITLVFTTNTNGNVDVKFENYFYVDDFGQFCLTVAGNGRLDRTDLGASWMIGKNITFSARDNWITIAPEANCTERNVSDRIPVPVRESSTNFFSILSIFLVFLLSMSLCLVKIVRSSLQSYSPVVDSVE